MTAELGRDLGSMSYVIHQSVLHPRFLSFSLLLSCFSLLALLRSAPDLQPVA